MDVCIYGIRLLVSKHDILFYFEYLILLLLMHFDLLISNDMYYIYH